jgi:hypothetical protein
MLHCASNDCHGGDNFGSDASAQVWSVVHIFEHQPVNTGVAKDLRPSQRLLFNLNQAACVCRRAGQRANMDHGDDWFVRCEKSFSRRHGGRKLSMITVNPSLEKRGEAALYFSFELVLEYCIE